LAGRSIWNIPSAPVTTNSVPLPTIAPVIGAPDSSVITPSLDPERSGVDAVSAAVPEWVDWPEPDDCDEVAVPDVEIASSVEDGDVGFCWATSDSLDGVGEGGGSSPARADATIVTINASSATGKIRLYFHDSQGNGASGGIGGGKPCCVGTGTEPYHWCGVGRSRASIVRDAMRHPNVAHLFCWLASTFDKDRYARTTQELVRLGHRRGFFGATPANPHSSRTTAVRDVRTAVVEVPFQGASSSER
jgi:hypothetical protein